jgi:hypothetical protein
MSEHEVAANDRRRSRLRGRDGQDRGGFTPAVRRRSRPRGQVARGEAAVRLASRSQGRICGGRSGGLLDTSKARRKLTRLLRLMATCRKP